MSDEYIRKAEAIKQCGFGMTSLHIADNLRKMRPSDVAPVVHAHWIRHDNADVAEGYYVPEYECSKCRAWKKDDSDFCPDCGAKMNGEE